MSQGTKATNLTNIVENASLRQGDVLISSFLPPTGGQGPEQMCFSQAEPAEFSEAGLHV